VTSIAYASGFQSLRRFNSAFREQYRMAPTAFRRRPLAAREIRVADGMPAERMPLRLTLGYRAPFAWHALLAELRRDAIAGVEIVTDDSYARTVEVDGQRGAIVVSDTGTSSHLLVDVSPSLVPALMPLIARLRHLFDLDAEPGAIDDHLASSGLAPLVATRPGLRVPGTIDGFEIVLRTLLRSRLARIVDALGEPIADACDAPDSVHEPTLRRLMPTAAQIARLHVQELMSLGASRRATESAIAVATRIVDGTLCLEPGSRVDAATRALARIPGVGEQTIATIVGRALRWPDAFAASDPLVQRAAGAAGRGRLLARAERWRPWRAYAALHLRGAHLS
jgi:AraC family transcriptional regulator of adaptative response / DNA-3-methyladenine glycosylase II